VARDATARLYDVDEDSVEMKKLKQSEKYDIGKVYFRAKKGRLISLDKLHESIWATRLSGGTRSGLVTLEVTAVGHVVTEKGQTVLKVNGSDGQFFLSGSKGEGTAKLLPQLRSAAGDLGKTVRVTGIIDRWNGVWPKMLRNLPAKPRRILLTKFELVEEK